MGRHCCHRHIPSPRVDKERSAHRTVDATFRFPRVAHDHETQHFHAPSVVLSNIEYRVRTRRRHEIASTDTDVLIVRSAPYPFPGTAGRYNQLEDLEYCPCEDSFP